MPAENGLFVLELTATYTTTDRDDAEVYLTLVTTPARLSADRRTLRALAASLEVCKVTSPDPDSPGKTLTWGSGAPCPDANGF